MIPSILVAKNLLATRAKSAPTISQISEALIDQKIAWANLEVHFATGFGYANATKSLKSIAKKYLFLQPYFRQTQSTNIYAKLDPSTEQNFDEAIKCKDKTLMVQQCISYNLASDAPNIDDTLKQLSQILVDFPSKNYKYVLTVTFNELDFGPHTLAKVTNDYVEGREEFMTGLSPAMRGYITKLICSFVQFSNSGRTLRIATHCLLPETSALTDIPKLAIPEKFTTFVHSLYDFKLNEIKRTPIYSTTELRQQKEIATQALAKRTSLSVDEIKEASVNYYNKLTLNQRIALEQKLYEHIFNLPYTREVPLTDANDQQKEFYLSMIQADMHRANKQDRYTNTQIGHLRGIAAKAMVNDSFVSFDALAIADNPVQQKLNAHTEEMNSHLKAVKEAASKAMYTLAQEKSYRIK